MGKSQITPVSADGQAEVGNHKSQNRKFKIKKIFLTAFLVALAISVFYTYRIYIRMPKKATITAEIPTSIKINQKITLPVFIDTAGLTINAAEVYLKFDPATLKVESVSKDDSFFNLWITDEPKFSNDKGEISFVGGLPKPGFEGRGQIGSVNIIPLKNGFQTLSFDQRSRILLNDGVGTQAPLKLEPIKIKIK